MAFLLKPAALLMLIAAQFAVGLVAEKPTDSYHISATRITTVTLSSSVAGPHTCYTKTLTTPYAGPECPDLATCGLQAHCIGVKTTTVHVPAPDPACPHTHTKLVDAPCETCTKGCRYTTSTQWLTEGAASYLPTPTAARREAAASSSLPVKAAACSTTIFRSAIAVGGATVTYHPLTQTRISLVNCNGCNLVVSDMNGVGPAVSHIATVTDTKPVIITTYACQ
ncbi:hypothetical protein B0J14DRAFT_355801 [Halenospora varia]|nr:hypothetical protein B0J14DRAFT_355801 [Halenospora varia]